MREAAAEDRRRADPARAVLHPRQLAESYLTGCLFRQILGRIERLAWQPM
jgi:hypothetical protein